MTCIDGYLSSIAQRIDPTALVVIESDVWLLRRPGHEDIRLGAREPNSYGDALQALQAWCRAQKASRAGIIVAYGNIPFVPADIPPGEAVLANEDGTSVVKITGIAEPNSEKGAK